MYHLLINFDSWKQNRDLITNDRVFEYTLDKIAKAYKPSGNLNQSKISQIPALFASEIHGGGVQFARVGHIDKVETINKNVNIEYHFESEISPIPNTTLQQISSEFGIDGHELSRTHWAIKDVDLFRVLLKNQVYAKISPKVFTIDEFGSVDHRIISVMMPFASEFNNVYETLKHVSEKLSLKCLRADDIWQHDAVIQDVVSLIYQSRIVICDCTGRNANVFYETGIAHTLGKDVILITQNSNDIPFDLQHLRFLTYLDNIEGREQLSIDVSKRIQTIMG